MKKTKSVETITTKQFQIPQTVTTSAERNEIRKFVELRLKQIKDRLDRIYRHKKESYVEDNHKTTVQKLSKNPTIIELVDEYNKDNKDLFQLNDDKIRIEKQIDMICDRKEAVSQKINNFVKGKTEFDYSQRTYGNNTSKHYDTTIERLDLVNSNKIRDRFKEAFDLENSKQMEERNHNLQYMKEKIEERLLFGKREEIQKLFFDLEKINSMVEAELKGLNTEPNLKIERK